MLEINNGIICCLFKYDKGFYCLINGNILNVCLMLQPFEGGGIQNLPGSGTIIIERKVRRLAGTPKDIEN